MTSSESSKPNLNLIWQQRKQMTPASKPMASDAMGFTKPAQGVMATSPATRPDAPPSVVA